MGFGSSGSGLGAQSFGGSQNCEGDSSQTRRMHKVYEKILIGCS